MPARKGSTWPWCVKNQPLNLNGWKTMGMNHFRGLGVVPNFEMPPIYTTEAEAIASMSSEMFASGRRNWQYMRLTILISSMYMCIMYYIIDIYRYYLYIYINI